MTSLNWKPYLALWLVMLAVRQDFWFENDASLVLGFLPVGLAYQVAYSLLASGVMWALVRFAWPRELEVLEVEPSGPGADRGKA
jgi:hypothetical protein